MEQVQIEVSHVLTQEQLKGISDQIYMVTLDAINRARRDSEIDSDLVYSKAALCRFLNNMSPNYLEELIADGLPHGRMLSERKIVFSKIAVRKWLLENDKNPPCQ